MVVQDTPTQAFEPCVGVSLQSGKGYSSKGFWTMCGSVLTWWLKTLRHILLNHSHMGFKSQCGSVLNHPVRTTSVWECPYGMVKDTPTQEVKHLQTIQHAGLKWPGWLRTFIDRFYVIKTSDIKTLTGNIFLLKSGFKCRTFTVFLLPPMAIEIPNPSNQNIFQFMS